MRKLKNNKGFTLVEMIIVIAVMSIITVVAAPQLMKYIEKANRGTDRQAIWEMAHAAQIAYVASEDLQNEETGTDDNNVVVAISKEDGTFGYRITEPLDKEVNIVIPEGSYQFKSKLYRGTERVDEGNEIIITIDANGSISITATEGFSDRDAVLGIFEQAVVDAKDAWIAAKADLAEIEATIENIDNEITNAQNEITDRQAKVDEAARNIGTKQAELTTLEGELTTLKQEKAAAEEQLAKIDEIPEVAEALRKKNEAKAAYEKEWWSISKLNAYNNASKNYDNAVSKYGAEYQDIVDEKTKAIGYTDLDGKRGEITAKKAEIFALTEGKPLLDAALATANSGLGTLKGNKEAQEALKETAAQLVESTDQAVEDAESALEQRRADFEKNRDIAEDLEQHINELSGTTTTEE